MAPEQLLDEVRGLSHVKQAIRRPDYRPREGKHGPGENAFKTSHVATSEGSEVHSAFTYHVCEEVQTNHP